MRKKRLTRLLGVCLTAALLAQSAAAFADAALGAVAIGGEVTAQDVLAEAVPAADVKSAPEVVVETAPAESEQADAAAAPVAELEAAGTISPENQALLEEVERQRLAEETPPGYSQTDLFTNAGTKKGYQGATDPGSGFYYSDHTLFNIVFSDYIANKPVEKDWYEWSYNGKTYYIDLPALELQIQLVKSLRDQGMSVSWVLLAKWNDTNGNVAIEGGSRTSGYQYYAPDPEAIGAFVSYAAWRCMWHGTAIDNWIVGNEANNPSEWHFSGTTDPAAVVSKYATALASVYNEVRKYSSISRVSVSLDHYWNYSGANGRFGARAFLDLLNREMEGRVPGSNWAVSFHLYAPEMKAEIWKHTGLTPNSPDATIVSGMNLNVLTDYVRSNFGPEHRVLLTEQGFNALSGDTAQAAALAISYYAAKYNSQVDCFIYNGQKPGDGTHDFALDGRIGDNVYRTIDNGNAGDQAAIEQLILTTTGRSVQDMVPNYGVPTKPVDREKVAEFVRRLYETCLSRTPADNEVERWVNVLASYSTDGSQTAADFVFSTEFKNKNLCNEDYIKILYSAFMDRTPSDSEVAGWVSELESGKTREEVFNGFALSKEFTNICDQYGIILGDGTTVPEYGTIPAGACSVCGKEAPVVEFVARLYRTCLNREPEAEGQAKWVNQLVTHANSGRDAAYGFVFSKEFINKNYSNTDYVKQLYRAFMGREFDQAGLDSWVKLLNEGTSREEVFDGFVGSKEFSNICARYGIVRG